MKKVFLILICGMLVISCSTNNDLSIEEKFYLVNVSGGFAGVNENFDRGQIIWTFNEQNSTLIIKKNTNEGFSGLNEGNYLYSIENSNNHLFLHIDKNELGGISIYESGMIIDENMRSTGSGADGFIMTLVK